MVSLTSLVPTDLVPREETISSRLSLLKKGKMMFANMLSDAKSNERIRLSTRALRSNA